MNLDIEGIQVKAIFPQQCSFKSEKKTFLRRISARVSLILFMAALVIKNIGNIRASETEIWSKKV